jgi:hypothetical protein
MEMCWRMSYLKVHIDTTPILILLMIWNYDIQRCDTNVHTRFHENPTVGSLVKKRHVR